jgi:hypothetical protein
MEHAPSRAPGANLHFRPPFVSTAVPKTFGREREPNLRLSGSRRRNCGRPIDPIIGREHGWRQRFDDGPRHSGVAVYHKEALPSDQILDRKIVLAITPMMPQHRERLIAGRDAPRHADVVHVTPVKPREGHPQCLSVSPVNRECPLQVDTSLVRFHLPCHAKKQRQFKPNQIDRRVAWTTRGIVDQMRIRGFSNQHVPQMNVAVNDRSAAQLGGACDRTTARLC